MNKKFFMSIIAGSVLLSAVTTSAYADLTYGPVYSEIQEQMQGGRGMQHGGGMMPNNGMMQHGGGMMPGGQSGAQNISDTPLEIVKSDAVNTAADLTEDLQNAVRITMSDSDSQVEIDQSGTYVISGSASDGNITVKKGTTGVILVLEDLDLTSKTGAALSLNKETEVRIIISGTVTLTDAEDPSNENSADAAVADAFDGAALKAKANSMVYISGNGTLNIIGQAKNGIKGGDDASLILDGPSVRIAAANDGINVNYDLTILSGSIAVSANDDAIHADHILTIGYENGNGPDISITQCSEGLEGTVVNIFGGSIAINSTDDAINAARKYDQITPSINMTGGSVTVSGQGDGFDSNGNVNLIGGSAAINVQYRMGEAGVDYDGMYYISPDFQMNNSGGVSGPDNMGGGQMGWGRP